MRLPTIRGNSKLHPDFILFHVKGHRDVLVDPNDLTFPAQLNIQADSLATTFQQASSHATDQGPMTPVTGCHLLAENPFIPGYHRRNLRSKRVTANPYGISRKGINYQMQTSHISIGTAALGPSITSQHKSHTFVDKVWGSWEASPPLQPVRVNARLRTSTTPSSF
jgi:hypothetical protein